MLDSGKTRRLFFALWPDADTRSAIIARREQLGELTRRRVPDHNLHLTLLFLGNQPADRVSAIEGVVGDAPIRKFRIRLDRWGWFPKARVAWLGGLAPPPARALVDWLQGRMAALDLDFDRRPFRPHVTLFRQVRQRPVFPDPEPVEWPVSEFSLIESIPGEPYQVLRNGSVTLPL